MPAPRIPLNRQSERGTVVEGDEQEHQIG